MSKDEKENVVETMTSTIIIENDVNITHYNRVYMFQMLKHLNFIDKTHLHNTISSPDMGKKSRNEPCSIVLITFLVQFCA